MLIKKCNLLQLCIKGGKEEVGEAAQLVKFNHEDLSLVLQHQAKAGHGGMYLQLLLEGNRFI